MLNLSAFSEAMLVHEHACVRIDPDMPLDRAAVIGCAVTTGAGTIFNACKVTPGETVAVVGCGGVGLATINAAKIAGAGRIIAHQADDLHGQGAAAAHHTPCFDIEPERAAQAEQVHAGMPPKTFVFKRYDTNGVFLRDGIRLRETPLPIGSDPRA